MKKIVITMLAGVCFAQPAFAQEDTAVDAARDGIRIEARVAYENVGDPENDVIYELGQGIAFGGEIGFDVAVSDTVVVGPFASYQSSTTEYCTDNNDFCVGVGGYLAAGLHVGFAMGENAQVYGKLGYAQLTIDAKGRLFDPQANAFVNVDESETGGGYEFAFGYEHGFGENIYARAEVSVGTSTDIYGFDFQRGSVAVAIGARF